MKVIIIGTGNVATVLGKRIQQAGHSIAGIFGRNQEHACQLAALLDTEAFDLDRLHPSAAIDIYIMAVSDSALYELPKAFRLKDRLVVHTAGSVPMDVLKGCSSSYGVLYPLQSLRRELDALTSIPLLIDANSHDSKQTLLRFARTLSEQVSEADDLQRMKLHVAAVITSNFTNHLYALAEDYCKKEGLDFGLLHPLIIETAQRTRLFSPAQMQTGPAIRKDNITIDHHLSLLQEHPALQQLYRQLTESIKQLSQPASERK